MITDWERLVNGYDKKRLTFVLSEFKEIEGYLKLNFEKFKEKDRH